MKLEKREVTLNEKDTLKDLLSFVRGLTAEYVHAAPYIEGESHRAGYNQLLLQNMQTIFYLRDLLRNTVKSEDGD